MEGDPTERRASHALGVLQRGTGHRHLLNRMQRRANILFQVSALLILRSVVGLFFDSRSCSMNSRSRLSSRLLFSSLPMFFEQGNKNIVVSFT
jgi:hypothetical protein